MHGASETQRETGPAWSKSGTGSHGRGISSTELWARCPAASSANPTWTRPSQSLTCCLHLGRTRDSPGIPLPEPQPASQAGREPPPTLPAVFTPRSEQWTEQTETVWMSNWPERRPPGTGKQSALEAAQQGTARPWTRRLRAQWTQRTFTHLRQRIRR